MPMPTNKLRGRLARNNGADFERNVASACRADKITLVTIPNGCKRTIRFGKPALIQVRTAFDFCAIYTGKTVFFDAKTISEDSFPKSQITPHQLESLLDTEQAGCTSGYLVRFPKHNRCVFYTASQLHELEHRKSLKPEDGIRCGSDFRPSLLPLFVAASDDSVQNIP